MKDPREYITVYDYDTPQDDFFKDNGLCVLMPKTAKITEELNGTYELYIEHPIDEEGRWRTLEIDNIIKADGQLFRIVDRKTKMSSNGEKVRTVTCMHIWYDLAGKSIHEYTSDNYAALWFVKNLFSAIKAYHIDDQYMWFEDRLYNFEDGFSTDCGKTGDDVLAYAHFSPANMVSAVIGTESSFVNVYSKEDENGNIINPELYRDNFRWSLNWRKENSVENAFSITHTIDMIDIEEVYDTSNYYTHVHIRDNLGHIRTGGVNVRDAHSKGEHVPRQPRVKQLKLQYNSDEDNEYAAQRFYQDADRYIRSVIHPQITLKCNYAELSNTDLYKDYIAAKHCNVGDTGIITIEELGITQTMKVVKKIKDLINPKATELTFGSKLAAITDQPYMAQTINNSKFTNAEFFTYSIE